MDGGHSTVWKGTAFSGCNNNEIVLLHMRFWRAEGDSGQCNDGDITARSVGVESNGNSYISRLEVLLKPVHDEMIMKNVTCVHDDGETETEIGSIAINTSVICMPSEMLNDSATNHTTKLKGN